jgi:uncharacterized Rmd1/YagE family protein
MKQCVVFATMAEYKVASLFNKLKQSYDLRLYREVIYLKYLEGHVFIFPYGTIVCWFLSEQEHTEVIKLLSLFQTDTLNKVYSERYNVEIDTEISISENTIYLNKKSATSMLAISHGLAQSEKLGVFEHKIDDLINEIQPFYQYLGKFGKIALTRKQISKKIGQLFSVRSFINLHMSILDTPDYFWEREELAPIYQQATHYLELKSRMHALNAKMRIIQELYDVLHHELQSKHSHRLEWIIIILIFIEVFLSLIKY